MGSGPLMVIAHEASRSGAPTVLLTLLEMFGEHLGAPLKVRLLAGGPLAGRLQSLDCGGSNVVEPAAVLVNGSLAAGALSDVDPTVPVAVYVHEDEEALDGLDPHARWMLVNRADAVVSVSERVRDQLSSLGVDNRRLSVLPPLVVAPDPPQHAEVAAVRQLLAPAGQRIVLGCGQAVWHKGPDLFIDVARRLQTDPDLSFAWIGSMSRSAGRVLNSDTCAVSLERRLSWVGEWTTLRPGWQPPTFW